MGPRAQQRKCQLRSVRFSNILFANGARIQKSVIPNLSIEERRMSTEMCVVSSTKIELDPCSNPHTPVDVPATVVQRVRDSTFSVPFRKDYLASNG